MTPLRFTLLADGPTDKVLLHHLRWLLINNGVERPLDPQWADLRSLPRPPVDFSEKIAAALELYPCDLLFVHRDAEREQPQVRVEEIQRAISRTGRELFAKQPFVAVVPVRMTEAWLLLDERAIRRAAGNPSGREPVSLPPTSRLETIPDPKTLLRELLESASGLPRRRLRSFSTAQAVHRVAELIEDFSSLRCLPAFASLEAEIRVVIEAL
jgi:hypothetical protein